MRDVTRFVEGGASASTAIAQGRSARIWVVWSVAAYVVVAFVAGG